MRDDFAFNVKFCELIENHAVIYDYNRSDYCNRNVQDQAWESIARTLKENVKDCKERWKNIRNRYAKYQKIKVLPSGSATKTAKEYYLAPHLNFLNRYMKSRPPKSNLQMQETDDDLEEPTSPVSPPSPEVENYSSPLSADSGRMNKTPTLKDVNKSAFDYFTRKKRNCEKQVEPLDTDLSFLQSMLSDMKVMNLAQKRKFKIGVMQLASQILDESTQETANRTNTIPSPLTSNQVQNITPPTTLQELQNITPRSTLHRVRNISSRRTLQHVASPSKRQQVQDISSPSILDQIHNTASPSILNQVQDENAPTFFTLSPYSQISSVSSTPYYTEEIPLQNNYDFSSR